MDTDAKTDHLTLSYCQVINAEKSIFKMCSKRTNAQIQGSRLETDTRGVCTTTWQKPWHAVECR